MVLNDSHSPKQIWDDIVVYNMSYVYISKELPYNWL